MYSDDDEEFIDFIERCLEIDPAERITPEEALRHPWIKRNTIQSVLKDNEDILQNIVGIDFKYQSRGAS